MVGTFWFAKRMSRIRHRCDLWYRRHWLPLAACMVFFTRRDLHALDAFKTIQDIGYAGCEVHFQSKVYGTYALEQALEGLALKYSVCSFHRCRLCWGAWVLWPIRRLISSWTPLLPGTTRRTLRFWISVNWDTWQVREDVHGSLGATVLAFVMSPEEGIEALTRALASGETHLVNSTGDLHARIGQWIPPGVLTGS